MKLSAKSLALSFIVLLVASTASTLFAQATDSNVYVLPPRQYGHTSDSLDSLYRARRAMVDRWMASQRTTPIATSEFASIYGEIGGLIRIRPADINEYFAERAYRPSPADDRLDYRSVDRAFILGAQFRLSRSWGIFVEYEYSGTFFNTIIDSGAPAARNLEESLDLNEHSLVTGGIMMLYNSRFYRLQAMGGIGAVYALVSEGEPASGASRSSSAVGFQLNFDLVNDFRVAPWGSVMIDLLTRSTSTGVLKTSTGETLDKPLGRANRSATLAPSASKMAFGFAVGLKVNL